MSAERPESKPEIQPEPEETELVLEQKQYNFEAMREFEGPIASLVARLKSRIEEGEYSALLSDDAGGRIPTLVLRKVFKEKGPNKDIEAYFLGRMGYGKEDKEQEEEYGEFIDHLKKMDFGDKRVLIITQFIASGGTLKNIGVALESIGIKNFDFASVDHSTALGQDQIVEDAFENSKVFIGQFDVSDTIRDGHNDLSGIESKRATQDSPNYSPHLKKSFENQEDYKKSREDLNLMAKRIIKRIWEEGEFNSKYHKYKYE